MRLVLCCVAALVIVVGLPAPIAAIEADEFDELVGYTVVAATEVVSVSEMEDGSGRARLANGMVFTVDDDAAVMEGESIAVFAQRVGVDELARMGIKAPGGKPMVLYKLLVADQLLDGYRVH